MARPLDNRAFRAIAALVGVAVAVSVVHCVDNGFPWWRHAQIVSDIVLGASILALAVWLTLRPAAAESSA